MRIASRPFGRAGRSAQATFLVTLGVLVLGWVAGCDDKHIGRPCEVNADAGTSAGAGTHVAVISSPVLQCPSRICILPPDNLGATLPTTNMPPGDNDGPYCTATCSTDDDCADGETGDRSNNEDHRCKGGFFCAVATTTGPFCCQKFCICHDFVAEPMGGAPTPESCMPGTGSTCANVH